MRSPSQADGWSYGGVAVEPGSVAHRVARPLTATTAVELHDERPRPTLRHPRRVLG
jgi:hypothetical protein